jgi:hypothetical protein
LICGTHLIIVASRSFAFPTNNFYFVKVPSLKTYLPKLLILLLFSVSVKAQSVYKTPSGAKYHLATCRTVKNVSEEIAISQAKELGLEPCKICKPQTIYASGSSTNKAQGQTTTVQCSGITKAGTRCKHITRIANGYCFQHQPK